MSLTSNVMRDESDKVKVMNIYICINSCELSMNSFLEIETRISHEN